MRARLTLWAATCPLRTYKGQSSRWSCEAKEPWDQDDDWEGYDAQLSGVAQKRDLQSFPNARYCGTWCDQEKWSFYDYEKAAKDHEESTKAVESARAALSLLNGTGAKAKKSCKKKTKEVEKDATAKV